MSPPFTWAPAPCPNLRMGTCQKGFVEIIKCPTIITMIGHHVQAPGAALIVQSQGGRGYFQKYWVGVCSTLPETLTLFQTKICDFPYPISDLIKNLIPYFRPEALEPGAWPERVTSCYGTYTVVGVNIKREMVLSPNDEEVANSSKNIPNSRPECTNHTLFQTKMAKIDTLFQTKVAKKTIPFGAAPYLCIYKWVPPPTSPRVYNDHYLNSSDTCFSKYSTFLSALSVCIFWQL